MTKSGTIAIAFASLALLLGCAHEAPRSAAKRTRKSAIVAPVRLGVLPPDEMRFADLAAAVSTALKKIRAEGSGPWTEVVTTKVSMEVAQLSLECVAPTSDCYAAVGKFLQVDRLLWAQLSRDDDQKSVKVTVELLDVGLGTGIGHAERSFPEHGPSTDELQQLVDEAMEGSRHGDAHAPPPVASKAEDRP